MASLLPAEVVQALEQRFGAAFDQASEVQKLALVAAAVERSVTHARLRSMTDVHPRDVTVALSSLVQRGMLESGGAHKRTFYFLPGERPAAEATPVSFELPGLDVIATKPASGRSTRRGAESRAESGAESRAESGAESVTTPIEGRVISALRTGPLSKAQLASRLGLRGVTGQLNRAIASLLDRGVVEATIPEKKRSRLQKYRLTSSKG